MEIVFFINGVKIGAAKSVSLEVRPAVTPDGEVVNMMFIDDAARQAWAYAWQDNHPFQAE